MHFPPHDSERIWYNSTRDGEMYSTALYGMCANLNGADVTAKGATVKSHPSGGVFTHRRNRLGVAVVARSSRNCGIERRWTMPSPTTRNQSLWSDPLPPGTSPEQMRHDMEVAAEELQGARSKVFPDASAASVGSELSML